MPRDRSRSERDSTRFIWVRTDLRDALNEILSPFRAEGAEDDIERIARVAELLDPGEGATFRFRAAADGETETLEVEIRSDLGYYLRIHGAGAPFRFVRDALEAYWRNSLGTIEGLVNLSVQELQWPLGSPPVLQLAYDTEKEFSCIQFRIEAELARTADSLHLELLGISPPGPICSPAFGPAIGAVDLDLPPGSYQLSIRYREAMDRYRLELTDSTAQLRSGRSTFTRADERLRLLYPSNSFALYCGTTEARRSWCERLSSWVADRNGISVHEFPPDGVIPFRRGIGTQHEERFYFRYADLSALDPVRSCLAELDAAIVALKGVGFTVELWTGELITAWGDPYLESATTSRQVSCLPALPPPAADSLSLEWVQAEPYSRYLIYGMSCEVERERQERYRRAREQAERERRVGPADSTPPAAPPAMLLPDVWRDAAERTPRTTPVVLTPNTSRSAVSRSRLHLDLRDWQCREGVTVGDVEKHSGVAWYWVEHEGDWYYLLPETTAEAVDGYLDLVERYGEQLAWSALEREGGPEPVAVGPDRLVIPGLHLYRWRP
ncbi:MAG: hypothetical protein ACREK5_07965 [Gemmatimonadota bacterium]